MWSTYICIYICYYYLKNISAERKQLLSNTVASKKYLLILVLLQADPTRKSSDVVVFLFVISLLVCNICKGNTEKTGLKILSTSLHCNLEMHSESQRQPDRLQEQSVFTNPS